MSRWVMVRTVAEARAVAIVSRQCIRRRAVEMLRRLVEDDEGPPRDQQAGEREALALAAGDGHAEGPDRGGRSRGQARDPLG